MNAVIDGEDISRIETEQTWDESAFTADRDGNANLHPLGTSAAPTRGPSPAPSMGLNNPRSQKEEDDELEKALALSRGEQPAGVSFDLQQQETGTIAPNGTEKKFGPATREEHNQRDWALVPYQSNAQEVVPDPPIDERMQGKALPGGEPEPLWYPRFLKHSPDGDYTPNLITILHAIPKVREAFLLRSEEKTDYGFHQDWWQGSSIPKPRIVSIADGSAADPDTDRYDEFIQELQRLTAFLDASTRMYASIGALTQTDMIKNSNPANTRSGTLAELFLQSWTKAALSKVDEDSKEQIQSIFNTVVGTNSRDGMLSPNLTLVDMSNNSSEGGKKDLWELMDNLLWNTDPDDDEMADNYIERPAEVIVMRLQQKNRSNTKLDVEVPASFHMDKYLHENIAATRQLRQHMAQGKRRLNKIEQVEKKLKNWQHPTKSSQIDTREMLTHTLGHFSGQNRINADKADQTNNASLDDNEPEHYAEIASKLEKIIVSIDEKLQKLAEEKEKTRQALSKMSSAPPPGIKKQDPKHRYVLRGVATKPNITYVLRDKSRGEVEEDDKNNSVNHMEDVTTADDETTTPPGMQWWRIEYEVTGSTAKITRTKAEDYDVLRAVELEHNAALLVYACDDANDPGYYTEELPAPLETFVARDSQQFFEDIKKAAEMNLQQQNLPPPAYSLDNEWSNVPLNSVEKADDQDSTRVEDADMEERVNDVHGLPIYEDSDGHLGQYPVSLGYGSRDDIQAAAAAAGEGRAASPPVVEIRLDDSPPLVEGSGGGGAVSGRGDVEMAEKEGAGSPLVERAGGVAAAAASLQGRDEDMGGVESQDAGGGGGGMFIGDGKEGK